MHKLLIFLLMPLSLFARLDPSTHFLLVRHGQTPRNAEGKEIQGWVDDAAAQLNTNGQAQAHRLGELLAKHYKDKIVSIYSSPLGRCMQTAQSIAEHLPNMPIIQDHHFLEICHGPHDTMSVKERDQFCLKRYENLEREFKEMYPNSAPDRFFKWAINPLVEREVYSQVPFTDNLETILQLFERATEGCRLLAEQHPGETILISTHAGLIKTLAMEAEYRQRGDESPLPVYYEHLPSDFKSQYLPGNCSLYHFVWKEGELTFTGTEDLEN